MRGDLAVLAAKIKFDMSNFRRHAGRFQKQDSRRKREPGLSLVSDLSTLIFRGAGTRSKTKRPGAIPLGFLALGLLMVTGCFKPLNLQKYPVPSNTLIIEFATSVKYVMELKIDGEIIPIRYAGKNRRLIVQGLESGKHYFNIHSISYVFGPEFEEFYVDAQGGAYFFVQSRKYRSALPKNRAQVSIRAYRKKLRKDGVNVDTVPTGKVSAYFQSRDERDKLWSEPVQTPVPQNQEPDPSTKR